ncbi:MAG: hypothetical protein Q9208_004245 [Pyrenodesmia sp. 3 TL-2023]
MPLPPPPTPPITSTESLRQYLASHSPSSEITSITPLTGGTANFLFRLTSPSGATKILKHAEPYIASSDGRIPFPVSRMDFEVAALRTIGPMMQPNTRVKVPMVLEYDAPAKVLVMSDGGKRTLKAGYEDLDEVAVKEMGDELGRWLARLHCTTRETQIGEGGNAVARTVYRWAYSHIADVAEKFGLDGAFCRYIDEKYGSLLATDDANICHGDFWPGNILLDDEPNGNLTVVDWEMCRRGCGATDVGQFAAEAYLLDRLRGGKGLREGFLRGYREGAVEGLLGRNLLEEEGFMRRVAVHMGVHLAYWPARVEWGVGEEETKTIVEMGHEVMRRGDAGDVEWLRQGMLNGLLG